MRHAFHLRNRGFVSNLADLASLLIGLTLTVTVRLVGELPISEVILIGMLPIMIAIRGRRLKYPQFKIIYALLALWLFGQVISDIYRQTAFVNWIRGDAAIIVFGADLLGLVILFSNNERRKLIFIAASAIGSIAITIVHPSEYAQDQPWKFGYAVGVTELVLLISCLFYARRRYIVAGMLILLIAGVHLIENFRGPVGVLLVVIVLVFPVIPERIGRLHIFPDQQGAFGVAVRLGLVLGVIFLAGALIKLATTLELVDEGAVAKNESQERAGSLLLGGRPEILVSSRAVMNSPIIGYGSWPRDSKYVEMLFDNEVESGVLDPEDTQELSSDLIPTHSHLMGAWVWAGFFGALFWIYVLWIVSKGIVRIAIERSALAPIYAFTLIEAVWGILFSPFGLDVRVLDSLVIVIACDLIHSISQVVSLARPRVGATWIPRPQRRRIGLIP